MPAPSKIVKGYGLLSKLEASYNAGGSLSTSTDGVILDEAAVAKLTFANDGARPAPPGTGGYQRRVPPSGGALVDLSIKTSPRGASAVYDASHFPSIHTLLRASLMDAALTTTGGLEKYEYTGTPITGTPGSLLQGLYSRGQLYGFQALFGEWTLTIDGSMVPLLEFHGQGLMPTNPTDAALPSIAYPNTNDPPKASNIGFTWNSWTPVLRKLVLKWGRSVNPRTDVNVGSNHAGFWGVTRTPQLAVTFEAPTSGARDIYGDFSSATQAAYTLTVGATQYNRYTILGPAAQSMGFPEEGADGDVAIATVTYQLNPSALGSNDELTWRFN